MLKVKWAATTQDLWPDRKRQKVSNPEGKGGKLIKHNGTVQGRPQEKEASNLERWVKLARQNPGNHTEESSLSGVMEGMCRD